MSERYVPAFMFLVGGYVAVVFLETQATVPKVMYMLVATYMTIYGIFLTHNRSQR